MWLRVALREIELVFGSALKQCAQERNWLYNYHTKVCWPSFGVEYFLPTNNSFTATLGKTPNCTALPGSCGQEAALKTAQPKMGYDSRTPYYLR